MRSMYAVGIIRLLLAHDFSCIRTLTHTYKQSACLTTFPQEPETGISYILNQCVRRTTSIS